MRPCECPRGLIPHQFGKERRCDCDGALNAKLVRQRKTGGFTKFPVGTIIAKDSFIKTKGGKPGSRGPILFMRKEKPGYDPSGGDWRYAFTRPDFSLIGEGKSGNVAFCKACHTAVKNRDYVYAVAR